MSKRLYILFFLSLVFVINLWLYYFSSDYRFFLKKLKYGDDTVIHVEKQKLTDDYVIKNDLPIDTKDISSQEKTSLDKFVIDNTDKEFTSYFSGYLDLSNLKVDDSMLFSITEEYPDNYWLYNWNDLSVYCFWVKSFDSMFDFFDVLSYDKALSLKKIKLYWFKSFFINLDKSDGFVRIVIEYKNHIYGLKIKKSLYNNLKENTLSKITK